MDSNAVPSTSGASAPESAAPPKAVLSKEECLTMIDENLTPLMRKLVTHFILDVPKDHLKYVFDWLIKNYNEAYERSDASVASKQSLESLRRDMELAKREALDALEQSSKADRASSEAQRTELYAKISSLEQSISDLKAKLGESAVAAEKSTSKIAELQASVNSLQSEAEARRAEIQSLKSENQHLKAESAKAALGAAAATAATAATAVPVDASVATPAAPVAAPVEASSAAVPSAASSSSKSEIGSVESPKTRDDDSSGKDVIRGESKDDVVDDDSPEFKAMCDRYLARGARASVSTESTAEWSKRKAGFVPPVYTKTDEQRARLKSVMDQSILFNTMDRDALDVIINAMQEVVVDEVGKKLIVQGDDGDCMYVVEKGSLNCSKKIPINTPKAVDAEQSHEGEPHEGTTSDAPAAPVEYQEKVVKTCVSGDFFGELALLHNCPRAASVIANEPCVLWRLDRDTFCFIVRDHSIKRRERYESFLRSVDLLKGLELYDISRIAEALRAEEYAPDQFIVKQGDPGNVFYILERGKAVALKKADGEAEAKEVMQYSPGMYFGELALLKNQPRAASVKAVFDPTSSSADPAKCRVLALDRSAFKRLMGSLEEAMKKNTVNYEAKPQAAPAAAPVEVAESAGSPSPGSPANGDKDAKAAEY